MFLHSVRGLENFTIRAIDGDVGALDEVYFDNEKWAIRYLVIDTGGWISKHDVLVSPIAIDYTDWATRTIQTDLTRQQIRDSPSVDAAHPVSRQHEIEFHQHYGYPYYWSGPYLWGDNVFPGVVEEKPIDDPDVQRAIERKQKLESTDPHLCSSKDVIGYAIRTSDDKVGHVDDLLFDDEDWSIQTMIVGPRNWWPAKHVLISPQRVDHIRWDEQCVVLGMTRAELESSPEYDSRNPPPSRLRQPPELRR